MVLTAALYKVDASGLNLRSRPIVRPDTRLAVLPRGHAVEVLGPARREGWVQVSTSVDGEILTGYVAARFLVEDLDFDAPEDIEGVSAVHLRRDHPQARRDVDGKRAFPIAEVDRPTRNPAGTRDEKNADLHAIIEWLDVEQSARYAPDSSRTFCNIYAHDYCYLAGVYLPRVWWTERAITRLQAGEAVQPIYAETVREKNANSLFNWLRDWGPDFGWQRVFDPDTLQDAANSGWVGVIVGQRHDLNRSGHIVVVVPENDAHQAIRRDGQVTRPLQSQAGSTNHMYLTRHWWTHNRFREFGFWVAP